MGIERKGFEGVSYYFIDVPEGKRRTVWVCLFDYFRRTYRNMDTEALSAMANRCVAGKGSLSTTELLALIDLCGNHFELDKAR